MILWKNTVLEDWECPGLLCQPKHNMLNGETSHLPRKSPVLAAGFLMEKNMDICPDCQRAGIPQVIKLEYLNSKKSCPSCGGIFNGRWIPAPKYGAAEQIMVGNYPRLTKRLGKWRQH
jgi:hypothetical protein